MPDYFNALRMWRVQESCKRGIRQGEIVSDIGLRRLLEEPPLNAWHLSQRVEESTFRTHGGELLAMARCHHGGEWADVSYEFLVAEATGEVREVASLLNNIALVKSLKTSGLSDHVVGRLLNIPVSVIALLRRPERLSTSPKRPPPRRASTASSKSLTATVAQDSSAGESLDSLSISVSDISSGKPACKVPESVLAMARVKRKQKV